MIVWMYRYCQSKAAQFLVPALLSALPAPTSAPRLKPHSCSMLLAIATGFATNHSDNSPNKTSPTENHLKLPVLMQVSYIIVTRTNVFLLMCIDIDIFSTCLIITLSYHSFPPVCATLIFCRQFPATRILPTCALIICSAVCTIIDADN